MPSLPRWKAQREQAQALLQTMLDEMEAYRDERTEQWQESEKAEAFQELIDQTDAARAAVEEIALD